MQGSGHEGNGKPDGKPRNRGQAITEMEGWLRLFFAPGEVTELRILGLKRRGPTSRPNPENGFYEYAKFRKMAGDALEVTDRAEGVYFTLNPVDPTLLARRANRLEWCKADDGAKDSNIVRRRWLLVDIDAKRPVAGISATDTEKAHAWVAAGIIRTALAEDGWPAPIVADSGNGYHLFYRIDLPPQDSIVANSADDELRVALYGLGALDGIDSATVDIDTSVFNPSRIVKLPGTMARKGESTADRPHRRARVLEIPTNLAGGETGA